MKATQNKIEIEIQYVHKQKNEFHELNSRAR